MPAKVRLAQEAKARELQKLVDQTQKTRKETKIAKRYHMVKFFDRRKVEREIDRLQKLRDGGEHSRELEGQVAKLRDDLMYVRHFPNDERYVSVVQAKDEKALRKIKAIKGRIRRKLAERAALTEADEGLGAAAGGALPQEDTFEDPFFQSAAGDGGAAAQRAGGPRPSSSRQGRAGGTGGAGAARPEKGRALREGERTARGTHTRLVGAEARAPGRKAERERYEVHVRPPAPKRPVDGKPQQHGAQERKQAGLPARTRAEGGRKRRRRK